MNDLTERDGIFKKSTEIPFSELEGRYQGKMLDGKSRIMVNL